MPKRRDEQAPYWQQLRVAEHSIITFALEHGQTIRGAARLLGISPNYLGERVRELGIPAPEVRPGPKPGTKRPTAPTLRVVSPDNPPTETLDEDIEDEDDLEDEDEEAAGEGEDEDDLETDDEEDEDEDEDEGDGEIEDASTGN